MRRRELDELQHCVDQLREEELAAVESEVVAWPPHFLVCHEDTTARTVLAQLLRSAVDGDHAVVHACADDRESLASLLPDVWVAVLHQDAGAIDGIDLGARIRRRHPRAEVVVSRSVDRATDAERAEDAGIRFVLSEADVAASLSSIVETTILYRKQLPTRLLRSRVARRLAAEHGVGLARLLNYAPSSGPVPRPLEEVIREAVQVAWADAQGNASQTARLLGTNPTSLNRLIDRYRISLPVFAKGSAKIRALKDAAGD